MATKSKWNRPLVKAVWIIYWVGFIVYLFFSRTPDYIIGKETEGIVVDINEVTYGVGRRSETHRIPAINFYVDSVEHMWSSEDANFFGYYYRGEKVTMIYNPKDPFEASPVVLFGYWFILTEVFTAFLIIVIITALITVVPYGYE